MTMMNTLEAQADEIPIEELTLASEGIINTLSNLIEVLFKSWYHNVLGLTRPHDHQLYHEVNTSSFYILRGKFRINNK
jgi:ferric iron reductase protein FhuF